MVTSSTSRDTANTPTVVAADDEDDDRETASNTGSSFKLPQWAPAFCAAAAAGTLFGFDIGSTSAVVRFLGHPGAILADGAQLDPSQLGLVASFSLFGALISSAFALRFGDALGRKKEIQLSALAFTAGLSLEAIPGLTDSIPALLIARALVGVGIGFGMHVAPTYIAETAPTSRRGPLLSIKEAAIVGGILGGYFAGWGADAVFPDSSNLAWHATYAAGLLVSVPLLLCSQFLSESPRWLVLNAAKNGDQEKLDDARKSFQSDAEYNAVLDALATTENPASEKRLAGIDWSSPLPAQLGAGGQRALVMGLGLVLFQQVTGQPSVLYYANRIFEDCGYGFEAAVGLGVFKLAATLGAAVLVESVGRRALLLSGACGMTICLAALTSVFSTDVAFSQTGALLSIIGFVGFYQLGFGPCTWLVLSEVFPLHVRSAALGFASLLNFGSNLFVTAFFELERSAVGSGHLFAMLSVLGAMSVVFIAANITETKGLSLEEIQQKLTFRRRGV
eukprot:CAMPEP_0185851170 /NCGR_PEP_ID=MMETSP1354-20130828/6810_1 /TAXON_ID=708628 /ORGANISM="Erythrolobus madagascarensis, Strain CCMP3276" /LENGTH=505 /DNA_ID=CAMNT_0028552067 /DNA_START=233 /DNA_END=1750 /DNA_ORIENTATION=-